MVWHGPTSETAWMQRRILLTVQAAAYFIFYYIAHFSKKKVKSWILMDFIVFLSGFFKTCDFFGWVLLHQN